MNGIQDEFDKSQIDWAKLNGITILQGGAKREEKKYSEAELKEVKTKWEKKYSKLVPWGG